MLGAVLHPPKEFFGSLDLLWEQEWGSPVPSQLVLSHISARGSRCNLQLEAKGSTCKP